MYCFVVDTLSPPHYCVILHHYCVTVFFMSFLSPQSFQTRHLKVSKSFYRNKVSLAYVLVTLLICIAQSFRHDLLVKYMLWWLDSFLNLQARADRGFMHWRFPDLLPCVSRAAGADPWGQLGRPYGSPARHKGWSKPEPRPRTLGAPSHSVIPASFMPSHLQPRAEEAEGKSFLPPTSHLICWDKHNAELASAALYKQLSEPYQHFACIVNLGKKNKLI